MNASHVKEEKRHLLELSAAERVRILHQDIWIDYPQSKIVLKMIKNLVQSPRQLLAPCLLICGEGGVGKTSIIRQLKAQSRNWEEKIIYIALNNNPHNLHFRDLLLPAMSVPTAGRGRSKKIFPDELVQWIVFQNIRAIVIDELHDALVTLRNEQLKFLSLIKGLSGEPWQLSIIGVGTALAKNALMHDTQLARRYFIHDIPRWSESESFRQFLASLEENLPLRLPSQLYSEEIVKFLLSNSNGVMDNVVKLIRYGAVNAITSGKELITVEGMRAAMRNPWNF